MKQKTPKSMSKIHMATKQVADGGCLVQQSGYMLPRQ